MGLKAEDAEKIEHPILAKKYQQYMVSRQLKQKQEQEKTKREQDKLEYQRNLQRYEQGLLHAIEAGYPFSDYVRNGLRDFQRSLGLRAEDITRIESSILRTKETAQNNQQIEKLRQQQKTIQDSKTDVSSKTLISDPINLRDNLVEEKGGSHDKTRRVVFYTVVGLVVSFLAAIALPSFFNKSTQAKESVARTDTRSMNRAQQAFNLEKRKFTSNIQELGIEIIPGITDYIYKTQAYVSGNNSYAISTAVSKQSGLKSYIGGVFLVTLNNELTTLAILCESAEPTTTPPSPPILVGQSPQCASGTTPVQW